MRMPAIFFGHGNPMNAVEENMWSAAWRKIGAAIPPPRAIVCVSAHWYLPATLVTAMPRPRTIHDFGGFPPELYKVAYPAPGDPQLAARVGQLTGAAPDQYWGLDHGTWSVLVHLYPNADIPVVQLSIDETKPASFHFALGKRLAPLRDDGILLMGSGNLVHNLHAYAWGRHPVEPFDWTVRFEKQARKLMTNGDDLSLVNYEALGPDAMLAAPTPDHFLPLLYVLGARNPADRISFPVEGIDGGSISMLAVSLHSPARGE